MRTPQALREDITRDSRITAEAGWDSDPTPYWSCNTAKKFVKMAHINKLFPENVWKYNQNNFGVKPKESKSKHFAHRALEVWAALYPNKPFGPDNKNIISYSLAAMVYAELELKKKVDWRSVLTRNKEDRTEYSKPDIPDNFSFFQEDVGDGVAPAARGANQNSRRPKKSIRDEDSVGKAICLGKSRTRAEDEEAASASRKLDSAITRLEEDVQDAGSFYGPNSNLKDLQEEFATLTSKYEQLQHAECHSREGYQKLEREQGVWILDKTRMEGELEVLKNSEVRIQGLHADEQKKCAILAQQLADVTTQLASRERALEEVRNQLQLQRKRNDMFLSVVDGESNKVDTRKLLQELEQLKEQKELRDVDRVVDSVYEELLDNDVLESEPRMSGPEGNLTERFGEMDGGGGLDNLPDSDSLSLPNFGTQNYTSVCEVVEPAPKVPRSQDLFATILNRPVRPGKQPVPDLSVFDMTEDLPATEINAEEHVMSIEPSTTGCGVEGTRKQEQATDSGYCAIQISAAMAEHDGNEDEELLEGDWEGVTVEHFDRLYRLLRAQYKEFQQRHLSSESTIQRLEKEIIKLRRQIEQLEGEIEELKALDDEELRHFAKTEEVQALEAKVRDLEGDLDREKVRFFELQEKYKKMMDSFFYLDHWEGLSLAKAVRKKLDQHLDEQFQKRVLLQVNKRVKEIIKDPVLQERLTDISRDEEYNKKVSKEAMNRFEAMEECLKSCRDPDQEITPLWLNWAFNSVSREKCLGEARKALAIQMAISPEGSENIKSSLALFEKARGDKFVPPAPITCWGDGSAMFERLFQQNNGNANIVKWEFEVQEGWLPYRRLSSHLIASEKKFVYQGAMAKWMETDAWCQVCFNPFGPEGAFQLGTCGHVFHVGCIQQSALHSILCPLCPAPLPRRFYELFGILAEMPIGFEFNEWNLPLDLEPHRFMNFTQWGDKLTWDRTLKRPQIITSLEWDAMSWMTSDYEVEIRARSMEDEGQREIFCRNFGGHWDKKHNRFFRIPEERVDLERKGVKDWPDWEKGHISRVARDYDTKPIGRAKFLLALKEAAMQYVELERSKVVDGIDDVVEIQEEEMRRTKSMDAFTKRVNSTIIQWRTYLASINGDTLVLSDAKVDEFVAMVEHARKILREGETDDTPTRKRKREEEEADTDHSPAFIREMQRVDENMRRAPVRASQRVRTRRQTRRLEFEEANSNAPVVYEIGESSSAAIMDISDSE